MDHSADGLMKNVASYDNRCELQNTPSTLSFERTLRPQHLLWPRLSECRIIISIIMMLSACWTGCLRTKVFIAWNWIATRSICTAELSGTLRICSSLAPATCSACCLTGNLSTWLKQRTRFQWASALWLKGDSVYFLEKSNQTKTHHDLRSSESTRWT